MNIDEIFSKGASYLISEKGYEDYISGKDRRNWQHEFNKWNPNQTIK